MKDSDLKLKTYIWNSVPLFNSFVELRSVFNLCNEHLSQVKQQMEVYISAAESNFFWQETFIRKPTKTT